MSYAPSTVAIAIKKGTLVRPSHCSKCLQHSSEVGKIEAHHNDYNKPLEIQWLCRKCHRLNHMETKPIKSTKKAEKLAFNARFTKELYEKIKEKADDMGVSMNVVLVIAAKEFIGKELTA